MSSSKMRAALGAASTVVAVAIALAIPAPGSALRQEATPAASYSCETIMQVATPAASHGSMHEMGDASPMAEMEMGIDLVYIDMMIPHHASIIALSEAALPRLTDERLQAIAEKIIDAQGAEIEELHDLREALFGSTTPMPMDQAQMAMMMDMMPGMGSMEGMTAQMDPVVQVQAFCAAENPDLAFIDLTIPHHETAIAASESVLEQSTNDEVRAFAERVIADQQAEIETLQEIRREQ